MHTLRVFTIAALLTAGMGGLGFLLPPLREPVRSEEAAEIAHGARVVLRVMFFAGLVLGLLGLVVLALASVFR